MKIFVIVGVYSGITSHVKIAKTPEQAFKIKEDLMEYYGWNPEQETEDEFLDYSDHDVQVFEREV